MRLDVSMQVVYSHVWTIKTEMDFTHLNKTGSHHDNPSTTEFIRASLIPGIHEVLASDVSATGSTLQPAPAKSEMKRGAFSNSKQTLLRSSLLVHYDPTKELILECDTSPEGVGAALSNNINGVNKPIGFRSRTLTSAEKNYSQLEKEALALIFGVTKLSDYLLSRTFTVKIDHEPLVRLLRKSRATPATAAARIQRWALTVGAYKYNTQYKPGQAN